MPEVRPFRALRFEPDVVGDLSGVVSPPYDVISPGLQKELQARHPKNVVRVDLPAEEPGDGEDDRYRRAARALAAWRSDGTLRKDPRPSLYAYEQAYRVPGNDAERVQRGFFGRLRLEPFGPGSGVRPHERTLAAPREDRYRLLRATGANLSPVVVLYEDLSGVAGATLARVTAATPAIDLRDDDGVRHRVWILPSGGSGDTDDEAVARLAEIAGAGPVTIADGHHRYETSLRYRDERRMSRSCEEDPAFDYILTLFLEGTGEPPTVLPTHRVVRNIGQNGIDRLWSQVDGLFSVEPVASADQLAAAFDGQPNATRDSRPAGGAGRFGLWSRAGGAVLMARREVFEPWLAAGGDALRRLDVTLLQVALERLLGIDPAATAGGGRIAYTKSVEEAIAWVDRSEAGADAAFLLEPTPVASIIAVAADGDVMPQKSTYFYPKPLTGLVINPHEW